MVNKTCFSSLLDKKYGQFVPTAFEVGLFISAFPEAGTLHLNLFLCQLGGVLEFLKNCADVKRRNLI